MRPISATIHLSALRHNLAVAKRHAPGAKAFAVIKANAYGHGLARALPAFESADGIALLELDAAIGLRETGERRRIALLEGFFDPKELLRFVEHRLTAVVHSREQLEMLKGLAAGSDLDVMLKVNTGMNRLGFAPGEFPAAVAGLRRHKGVGAITVMTHFANADDARGVDWQMAAFEPLVKGGNLPVSLANSAAILRYPNTHRDWIRPGIMLYGCSPFAESVGPEIGLQPAMTLEAQVIGVQNLKPGDVVGYGGIFTADREMRIGVVACGYADGYPRHAPNGTPVAVDGRLTGTVGRASMDMLCVDLTSVLQAGVGSRAVLWGEGNPIERVAIASGTVGYELMCALAPRVPVVAAD
jgi:alanine racemase